MAEPRIDVSIEHKNLPESSNDEKQHPNTCPGCGSHYRDDELAANLRVCPQCGHHFPVRGRERIEQLADKGTFREEAADLRSEDPLGFFDLRPYTERIAEAEISTGLGDAMIIGGAAIENEACVLAVMDFSFMGGSMGSVVGERFARACERAAEDSGVLISVSASGGARMQEGILALMQLPKTVVAVEELHEALVTERHLLDQVADAHRSVPGANTLRQVADRGMGAVLEVERLEQHAFHFAEERGGRSSLQEPLAQIGEAPAVNQVELDHVVGELAHGKTEEGIGTAGTKPYAHQVGLVNGFDDEMPVLDAGDPAVAVQPFARIVIARQHLVVVPEVDDDLDHGVRQHALALVRGHALRAPQALDMARQLGPGRVHHERRQRFSAQSSTPGRRCDVRPLRPRWSSDR